ncbi:MULTISPECIES: benzoate/H(+) symporter BenE family transporter [unclassified Paenibacillus]|uniref:benzoate/H(+) symporter BenE family transporter n=1 Tax=unclassified Paenibacillus TaxID=185978 RepID=UPI001AE80B2C|nr:MULTISPECIES: benzoate/H(+) symporter BenE family transporter [unclassified Paenibacillus]MBP1154988.1 benzoate membrane transport protein [Paenibacillus sp. PvP091]MBP1169628.1 benzoate membrane transport protein [Paenibacillus sp. PvR098]MBP2440656.1 benzoate membrane transport protein [Paenibacillus sp. PvP052]
MNSQNVTSGIITALLACTGPVILLIDAANAAGFSRPMLISWIFAVYFFGGLLNLVLSLMYKIPTSGAHSITAAAFLSTAVAGFSVSELAGSYIMAGIVIAIVGFSGVFEKWLRYIPRAMLDAMLAGLVLTYIVKMVPALKQAPIIGGFALLGFLAMPKLSKKIPPIIGVLLFAVIGLWISGSYTPMNEAAFVWPQTVMPSFSTNAFISITIPVAVLILSNDIAVALAALRKNGYEPPANRILAISGLATTFVGFFGGHAAVVGGIMSAICSQDEAGPKHKRYWGAAVSGGLVLLFGLFAWGAVSLIEVLPPSFITIVAGFTMVGVLMNSLQSAFSESSYRYSTVFAFAIAVSNVSFLGIAAPVWSLMFGVFSAKILGEGIYFRETKRPLERQLEGK